MKTRGPDCLTGLVCSRLGDEAEGAFAGDMRPFENVCAGTHDVAGVIPRAKICINPGYLPIHQGNTLGYKMRMSVNR